MSKITNETLIGFLKQIITKLETTTYDKEEFLKLICFYLQSQPVDNTDEFSDEKVLQYAMLGWYLSSNLGES